MLLKILPFALLIYDMLLKILPFALLHGVPHAFSAVPVVPAVACLDAVQLRRTALVR
jgi:hypothetical protein